MSHLVAEGVYLFEDDHTEFPQYGDGEMMESHDRFRQRVHYEVVIWASLVLKRLRDVRVLANEVCDEVIGLPDIAPAYLSARDSTCPAGHMATASWFSRHVFEAYDILEGLEGILWKREELRKLTREQAVGLACLA